MSVLKEPPQRTAVCSALSTPPRGDLIHWTRFHMLIRTSIFAKAGHWPTDKNVFLPAIGHYIELLQCVWQNMHSLKPLVNVRT